LLYFTEGRSADAEPLYQRSLTVAEKALGPEHPFIGIVLNNLAKLYIDQGRFAEAEPLYRRTVSILESRVSAGTTRMSPPPSTIWPNSMLTKATTPKPSRSISAA
jgi:tetratricopeptide (TPR) repeat protein